MADTSKAVQQAIATKRPIARGAGETLDAIKAGDVWSGTYTALVIDVAAEGIRPPVNASEVILRVNGHPISRMSVHRARRLGLIDSSSYMDPYLD